MIYKEELKEKLSNCHWHNPLDLFVAKDCVEKASFEGEWDDKDFCTVCRGEALQTYDCDYGYVFVRSKHCPHCGVRMVNGRGYVNDL